MFFDVIASLAGVGLVACLLHDTLTTPAILRRSLRATLAIVELALLALILYAIWF